MPARTLRGRLLRIATIVIAIGVSFAVDTARAIQEPKEILVLYSTRRDAQIVTVGDREIPRILEKGLPEGLDYYSEFIDEGRFSEDDYQAAFGEFLGLKYRGRQFDLIIAMGESPLEFVTEHRNELFKGVPLVYFADRSGRVPKHANATGVIARVNLAGTVSLATALQPDTKNIFVVSGVGANALLEAARQQLRPFEPRLAITYLAGLPVADLEARLARLPAHSIVYYLVLDRDGAGEKFHPLEYLSRVTEIANAPVYSWVDSAMDRGIVGGSLKDQVAQAQAVGEVALQVLRGRAGRQHSAGDPRSQCRASGLAPAAALGHQ